MIARHGTSSVAVALFVMVGALAPRAGAQGSVFTYQGQLRRSGGPVSGTCDFRFELFDAESGGMPIGDTNRLDATTVSNGLFAVPLDFGDAAFRVSETDFFAAARWLQISLRCPAGSGSFSTLQPRQQLTAAPHALYAPLVVRNADGKIRAAMDVLADGSGFVRTRGGVSGEVTTLASSLSNAPDNGYMAVFAAGEETAAMLAGSVTRAGIVRTNGPGGIENVFIGPLLADPDHGFVSVTDNGQDRVAMLADTSGAGVIEVSGPNRSLNVYMGFLSGNPDHGYVSVADAGGVDRAGMYVDEQGRGVIFADDKAFVVDHPSRPDTKVVYTSLEGPEAAIYHRGVVHLVNGRAFIDLPEHFTALANPETITVQLTPGSFASEGLAFGAIRDGRIEVGELHNGRGTYDVHFVVHALRRGYEGRQPVVSRSELQARLRPLSAALARRDTGSSE